MIRRMRNRFIRIATGSVAAVMLLLTIVLNVANWLSTDGDLRDTLDLIASNQGTLPQPEQKPPLPAQQGENAPQQADPSGKIPEGRGGPFTAETPFSTRFFVLRYDGEGTLEQAELDRIAAVTNADVDTYLQKAVAHGLGYGYCNAYRFLVVQTGEDRYMAIFLDAYQAMRSGRQVLLWSLAADCGCIFLVFLLVVICSRRAIDPMVRSAQRQKQFITDASHELKTPITVIATSLKVLEMESGKGKWIDKARAQTEKLTELVNSLVTLSRMDEEQSPLRREPFPVSDAVRETAESFRDYADSQGHALCVEIAPDLTYRGDEYAVRQLTSILLDNAVKYADPGAAVYFGMKAWKRGILIWTENACPPMERAELQRLFDRFYRVDGARGGKTGGFGIGLSIARSIVELHGGAIAATMPREGCLRIQAELRG